MSGESEELKSRMSLRARVVGCGVGVGSIWGYGRMKKLRSRNS